MSPSASRQRKDPPAHAPWRRARPRSSSVAAPSGGRARSISSGTKPMPVEKNSGSTISSAPSAPARSPRRSQAARLKSRSATRASSWIAAASTARLSHPAEWVRSRRGGENDELSQVRAGQLRGHGRQPLVGRARALQHRRGRVRQARPRPSGDGLGGLPGQRAPGHLRRAAGPLEQVRQRPGGRGSRARGPGGHAAALAARDRRGVHRHLQERGDPAVDVRPLRRRGHRAPPARLRREGAGHRLRERGPHPRGDRRDGPGDGRRLRGEDGGRLGRLRDGRHRRRRPGPALLLVGHHRQGQGHPARPPLPAGPRGVRVLPRRARRRALPRHGRVGLGRGHLPAAGAVALRLRGARVRPQGRLRPRRAAAPSSPSTACRTCSPRPPRCGR